MAASETPLTTKTRRHEQHEWSGEPFVARIVPWATTPPIPTPIPGTVVVNEFRTCGPAGANDEFVEIRNDSASAINIGGWRIDVWSGSGSIDRAASDEAIGGSVCRRTHRLRHKHLKRPEHEGQ